MEVCDRSFSTATQCKGEERGVKCSLNFNRGNSCHYCVSASGKAFFGSHLSCCSYYSTQVFGVDEEEELVMCGNGIVYKL
jgi:hypothetical protein